MDKRLRFGILSTGNIAKQFAGGVAKSKHSQVVAVGSRNQSSADGFAKDFDIAHAYDSYDQLIQDLEVEAIYNALPNTMHHEWTIKALEAGKHVLCEKPIAANVQQAQEMFEVARREDRVLVEAFMFRCHPLTDAVVKTVRDGEIGAIRQIRASFCFNVKQPVGNIRFDPTLAGGSIMDIGCYCTNFARLMAGSEPIGLHCDAQMHELGVDERAFAILHFPGKVEAMITSAMTMQANNAAVICGEDGYIEVPVPWKPPEPESHYRIVVMTPPRMDGPSAGRGPSDELRTVTTDVPLYGIEADRFAQTVWGEAEPAMTEHDTLGNMVVLDEMRKQVGLDY